MGDKEARVYASVDEEFKKELRVEAARRDMSMAELVREILLKEFGDGSGNPKNPAATAD